MRSLSLVLLLASSAVAQTPQPGYTLFAPVQSSSTHLLDNSGIVAHTWPGTNGPGVAVYLKPNGNLLRTMKVTSGPGGTGGRLQEIDWNGDVVWDYWVNDATELSHHDVAVMPNGNVLILAWDIKPSSEAVAAGRDPQLLQSAEFRSEKLMEVEPVGFSGGKIVWEWRLFDHLVQDEFSDKPNFGDVSAHPELVDLNYPPVAPNQGDWIHANSVDYDPLRDEVVLNAPNLGEFWIIDHSTTTAEAAGHSGGAKGRGGDLLYRWGNPGAYGAPGATQLFFQHDANVVPAGFPGAGNVIVFNNNAGGIGSNSSSVVEVAPPRDPSGNYVHVPGAAYDPFAPLWEYSAPNPSDFHSLIMSGAVRLENGNTLVCSATQGWFFEVDAAGQLVWEHDNVLPSPLANTVFKVRRYTRWLWSTAESISAASGGAVGLELLAGAENGGKLFLMLGSASGTSPGITIGGVHLPLSVTDPYFQFTLASPNTAPLPQSLGLLDMLGRASTSFVLPAGVAPAGLIGVELNHAYVVLDPLSGQLKRASNAVPLELAP